MTAGKYIETSESAHDFLLKVTEVMCKVINLKVFREVRKISKRI